METPYNDTVSFESADDITCQWDSTVSKQARAKMVFSGDRCYLSDYQNKPNSMTRLEDKFRTILTTHTTPISLDSLLVSNSSTHSISTTEDESFSHSFLASKEFEYQDSRSSSSISSYRSTSSSIREIDLISSEAIEYLRTIADKMNAGGCLQDCVQVYGSVRKSAMDENFRILGVEILSIGDVQKLEWEVLEKKIRRWIRAAKVCVRTLFASERKLCEQIFDGFGNCTEDDCFAETVKGHAIQLFSFAELMSVDRRSPEKLFKMLDLHDVILDLLPDIEFVFGSKSTESIRVQAADILSRLAEAARGVLSEFENAVLREPSRVPVPGGTIHPLTRYVMNYVSLISDYKQTLELIVSMPLVGSSRCDNDDDNGFNIPDMDFEEHEGKTPLGYHLIWIIMILQFNLEEKSNCYKDASLAHLFMMNNVHYIVEKSKGSMELIEMIGDDYLRKLTWKFRQAATIYQRSTWVSVLYCLRDEGLHERGGFSSGVSKSALRERFRSFNAVFDEVHGTQSTWHVPDEQLREDLRISISELLIPAYTSFLGRYRGHIESGKHPEKLHQVLG